MHTDDLEFEWDDKKDQLNRKKHGVRFADAATAVVDEQVLVMDDENPLEQRYVAIGRASTGEILLVCFTWRGETIRLISARRADVWERQRYEGGQ